MPRPDIDVVYYAHGVTSIPPDRAKLVHAYVDDLSGEVEGQGWTLAYLLEDGTGQVVYIGGDLLDVDEAVAEANRHLDSVFGTDG